MDQPIQRDVVLIGGGHTHALFLRMWGMNPVPGVRITLISRSEYSPYSGMLPGLVAGHFNWEDTHIDLVRLCQFAGARFIAAEVTGLDPDKKRIYLRNRSPVDGDILSINAGITPNLDVPGSRAFAAAVKPIHHFYEQWRALRKTLSTNLLTAKEFSVGVVGGGVAGVELIQAMQYALQRDEALKTQVNFHLVHAGSAVPEGRSKSVQGKVERELTRKEISVHTNFKVKEVFESGLESHTGKRLTLDSVFWCTSAVAPAWPKDSGLACASDGCIRVNAALRSISHPEIYACGDIAHLDVGARPKAGVYAVRQAPVLYKNIVATLTSRPLTAYKPQNDFLSLITGGEKTAIAAKWGLAVSGQWVWRWKEKIDQRFMRQFQDFPVMKGEASPPVAPEDMRCGGCGAKVGAPVLYSVLSRLESEFSDTVDLSKNDSAELYLGESQSFYQSIDFFRAFVSDHYRLGYISALHALGDLFAMNAKPHSVLALSVVPHSAEVICERDLYQLMAGAVAALQAHHCKLVGGHSGEGAELSIGFSVNGVKRSTATLQKHSPAAGDRLILTKPLGSGTLFAAYMQNKAKGEWIEGALQTMEVSNRAAGEIASAYGATACTDITGFGLLGHLSEMLAEANLAVHLDLENIPSLAGARETIENNVLSTMHEHNKKFESLISATDRLKWQHSSRFELLFDPQTAGGLLISVPEKNSGACLVELRKTGYERAEIIGQVSSTDEVGPSVYL